MNRYQEQAKRDELKRKAITVINAHEGGGSSDRIAAETLIAIVAAKTGMNHAQVKRQIVSMARQL